MLRGLTTFEAGPLRLNKRQRKVWISNATLKNRELLRRIALSNLAELS